MERTVEELDMTVLRGVVYKMKSKIKGPRKKIKYNILKLTKQRSIKGV